MRPLPFIIAAAGIASLSVAAAETPPTPSATPSPAPSSAPATASAPAPTRSVELRNAAGATVGHADFWAAPGGVLIRVTARGLSPGWHGMHLHETGDCSAAGFTSAGAHMRGAHGGAHGLLNPSGPEPGDIPNIFIGADGQGAADVFTRSVTLTPDGELPAVLDADGSALVIHAAADDYLSQPSGGSGARVACGVIR